MNDTYNKSLAPNARELRKNLTKEEKRLWYDFLKKLPINVNRQKIIGRYIVDFYIPRAQIVIELDGAQHYEPDAKMKDEKRDECLENMGILVLRYTNRDVDSKFNGVCADISRHINNRMENGRDNEGYTSSTIKDGPPSPPVKGEG